MMESSNAFIIVTLGHSTVMATAHFFGPTNNPSSLSVHQLSLKDAQETFNSDIEYEYLDSIEEPSVKSYALLVFQQPVIAPRHR
jgi:hypothetical protein